MLYYMSLNDLFEPVKSELDQTIDTLSQNLQSDNILLNKIISYNLSTGGKRIRPALSLLTSKLFLEKLNSSNITIAQIAEIIHSATLLHDDVIDTADIRRGHRTVNDLWGNKISVIYGDFLLSRASVMLASLNNTYIVEIFAKVLEEICLGEIQQSSLMFDTTITWDDYILKSTRKSAILFASAMEGAAIVSNATEEQTEAVKNFGLNFGLAFQIIDDILNFHSENQVGKPSCLDLKYGILTAPVIYALKENASLTQLINTRFKNDEDFNKAIEVILNSSGLEKSKQLAQSYVEKAIKNLSIFGPSKIKNNLVQLAEYVIERDF